MEKRKEENRAKPQSRARNALPRQGKRNHKMKSKIHISHKIKIVPHQTQNTERLRDEAKPNPQKEQKKIDPRNHL
jgi:hypothetical protein